MESEKYRWIDIIEDASNLFAIFFALKLFSLSASYQP